MAQPRKLQVEWDALLFALEDSSRDYNEYYLNMETGEVAVLPLEFLDGAEDPDEDAPAWMRETAALAKEVEEGEEGRWVNIPFIPSGEAYEHMERFVETVADAHHRDLLEVALDGRGAFRRFRDVLGRSPEEQKRWHEFRERLAQEWALGWLESIGVDAELVDPYKRPPQSA